MLAIQDTELMQLMHEQQSPNWLKQRDQLTTIELPIESYFLLPTTFSIIAIVLGPLI
jgi:hypothetical protein